MVADEKFNLSFEAAILIFLQYNDNQTRKKIS